MARQLNNRLKIISGEYKSRLIDILDKPNLRPSKAYIRETLFNVIDISLCKSSLDLFAGSGILSFEALSRGIDSATLIERDSELVKCIQSNITLLDIKGASVIKEKAEKFLLKSDMKSYDLIFMDPPYKSSLLIETFRLLKNHNYLENNKFLYFERSKSDVREYDDFFKSTHIAIKDLSIGDVSYTILINKNL